MKNQFWPYLVLYDEIEVNNIVTTVKPVCNDHPLYPKIVAVVDKLSLFRGHLCYKCSQWNTKWWSLLAGGRYSEEVVSSGLTVIGRPYSLQ